MRPLLLACLLCALPAAAEDIKPFPLPSPDGKALAAEPNQKTFHVPFRFARVEQFYRERFKGETKITFVPSIDRDRHVLTLKSARPSDSWAKAVIHERDVDTSVEVTQVIRAGPELVEGNGKPLVELVITRSKEFDRQVESIDHSDDAHR
jgi:hypothetical protein